MKLPSPSFKLKKLPYYLFLLLLTAGASLILGFLSFSGMFALFPILSLAIACFGLSVVYEGEIYLQNIKGALNKLFKHEYLEHTLAKKYLLEHFPIGHERYELEMMAPNQKIKKNIIYILFDKQTPGSFKYFVKGLDGTINKGTVKLKDLKNFNDKEPVTINTLKKVKNKIVKITTKNNHTFPKTTKDADCPQFFRDYKAQLKLLEHYNHKENEQQELEGLFESDSHIELDDDSKEQKKHIEKTLKDMDHWFAKQLFSTKNSKKSAYAMELQEWLLNNKQKKAQELLKTYGFRYNAAKAFSIVAGLFMGLGSTYLIVEAFSVIPFLVALPFTFWPLIIVPMAVIAGLAYGLLTYNAITDMINNNTVIKWYHKIRHDLSQGLTLHNVFIAAMAIFLVTLAVALTICTAGTWWTIATNARPLFSWMKHIPKFVMGVINPVITGFSAIFFNIQNTATTMELVDKATKNNISVVFQTLADYCSKSYKHLLATENLWQIFNPFRILLKLTVMPLRILLFIGHLVSIALTADRMPGIPQMLSMLVAIISEGFEDVHYFVGHDHSHSASEPHAGHEHHHDFKPLLLEHLEDHSGHNHDLDIPTWALKTLFIPVYALAAAWDCGFSTLTFEKAWDKQRGNPAKNHITLPENPKAPSENWQKEQAIFRIKKHERNDLKHAFFNPQLATDKMSQLKQFKKNIRQSNDLKATLNQEASNEIYGQHRLFTQERNAKTKHIIEDLPQRVRAIQA